MNAERSARLTVNLTPEQHAALRRFAEEHRWPLSTAAVVLIERGLAEAGQSA
jgi:hypothetical protein